MLTSTPPQAPHAGSRPLQCHCLAAAHPLGEVRSIFLGSYDASSPRLALRWLQERTRHITDQLDAAYAQPGLHWLTDETEHDRALACMTAGTAYQLTLYDENTRYVLVTHPTGATS